MVSRNNKKRMQDFVTAKFEEARRFRILDNDESHIVLQVKPEFTSDKLKIYVFLHNQKMPLSEYNRLVRNYLNSGQLISNIFYKDYENFMVRLGRRGKLKGDDQSLKRYDKKEIDRMIHLRGLEKAVLDKQREDFLVYFQPETERLQETVRGYELARVVLDYSHVDKSHRSYGFVENRVSIDYKIANEKFSLSNGGLTFRESRRHNILILNPF